MPGHLPTSTALRSTAPCSELTGFPLSQILSAVAARLADMHAAGFVHRAVKPANVLVTSGGGLRLAHFGLARSLASPAAPLGAATGGGAAAHTARTAGGRQ